ncbi:MAG: tetratricopeptide repeat protein, partial [Planctomycetia bacterium]|nr:tetratricopeptide repeat protein [Planctomycetia bacterium]
VRVVERLDAVELVLADLAVRLGGPTHVPGALEGEGVTIERMRRFAEAAAAFYRAAPWQHLTDVDLLCIEEPGGPREMKWAAVLGAGGLLYGLGFYSRADHHFELRQAAGALKPRGNWHFSLGRITQVPLPDADLWEAHNLPLAGRKAYPCAMRQLRNGKIGRPRTAELTFLEGLLWALAETSEAEIDSGRWQKAVTTFEGEATYVLAIPDLLHPPSPAEWMRRGFLPERRSMERLYADMDRYFEEHPPADTNEMNEVLQRAFMGKRIDELVTQPRTPLEQAQEVCFQAFETYGRRRVQLARQALGICADCADAHGILAELAGTAQSRIEHYGNAMAAAERTLGPETFEKDAGHFWGVSRTRPYMRARFGLAESLQKLGRKEEAVQHYQELLGLNPNDNQGARYVLMPLLLELGRDADAAKLLTDYKEASANWAYARALLAFRISGRSLAARREMETAFRTNRYVPEYLLEDGPLPVPDHYSPGDPDEALVCTEELRPAYRSTPGATEWLAAEWRRREKELDARRRNLRRKQRKKQKRK